MQEILAFAQNYFDLLYTCDVTKFEQVFHENAQLQAVGKDGYAVISSVEYKEMLRQRKSPASQKSERCDEVITVDQSSNASALLKVRVLINGTRYCDYLSLLKINGSWRIASKVYCVVPS